MAKFYHASFTRVGEANRNDGWQAINMSPDIPQGVIDNYVRFQNGNVSGPEFSDDDQEKIVMELQTDNGYAYLTYIKYGLKDHVGRPSMFANSRIFDINTFITNPNTVLCVKRNDFSFDPEMINQEQQYILSMNTNCTLCSSMEAIKLDFDKYINLVKCTYDIITAQKDETLHIICNYNDDIIRHVMFCIYEALPLSFRRALSFSSHELRGARKKTIVFSREKKDTAHKYFILETGENSLTDAVLKKYENYEFIKDIIQNPQMYTMGRFKYVEKILSRFDSPHSTSLDLIKIPFDIVKYGSDKKYILNLSDDKLLRRLGDLLNIKVLNQKLLDAYINRTLNEIINRKINLNDIYIEKLCTRISVNENSPLFSTVCFYITDKIKQMDDVQKAAEYIHKNYNNRSSAAFLEIKKYLVESEKGIEILKNLYLDLIARVSFSQLESIIELTKELNVLPETVAKDCYNKLVLLVSEHLKNTMLSTKIEPTQFINNTYDFLEKIFYTKVNEIKLCIDKLKEAYWQNMSMEEFDFNTDYSKINCNDKMSVFLDNCKNILNILKEGDLKLFINKLDKLLDPRVNSGRKIILERFTRECLTFVDKTDISMLELWLYLTGLLEENPVDFLLKNEIFTWEFPTSDEEIKFFIREKDFIEKLEEYAANKKENYEIIVKILRTIRNIEKIEERERLEEEKRYRKEEKKLQKQNKETQDNSLKKNLGNFMDKLFKKTR